MLHAEDVRGPFPGEGGGGRDEPVPPRDRERAGAVRVRPPVRSQEGDGEGEGPRGGPGREGPPSPAPRGEDRPHPRRGCGDWRRDRRDPRVDPARQPRSQGHAHREEPYDRRQHGALRQDVPHPRLRDVHPLPEDERGVQPPERQAPHVRGGEGRRPHAWEVHPDRPQEASIRDGCVHRLQPVHGALPREHAEEPDPGRVRMEPGPLPAQGDLPSVLPGPPAKVDDRPGPLLLLPAEPRLPDLRDGVPGGCD